MTVSDKSLANAIRALSMDAVQAANSGHPGMPMGMADVATVLFSDYLKFDPTQPKWADRDRFVLSAGHGSMLIYSLLHLTGYARPTIEDIANFRQLHSPQGILKISNWLAWKRPRVRWVLALPLPSAWRLPSGT